MLLLVWGVFYLFALAPYPGAGSDFDVFYAASRATAAHADPYDWATQWRWENLLFNEGRARLPLHFPFAPYGNLPPFAALLIPLCTTMTARAAYAVWSALALLATLVAGVAVSRWAGYRRPLALGLLLLLAPCATFDLFLGQDSWLVLLALASALALLDAAPIAAGAMMVLLGFPKPHLLLPLAAVVLLAFPARRRRFGGGLALGGVGWLALTVTLTGAVSLGRWWRSITFYHAGLAGAPDIASLAGLYTAWAPARAVTVLDALLLMAGALFLLAVRPTAPGDARAGRRFLALGVATTVAVLPFVHTHDDMLLAVPLLLLIGRDWSGLRRPPVLMATVVTLLVPLAVWTDYHRPLVGTLPALCTLLACLTTPASEWPASGAAGVDGPR